MRTSSLRYALVGATVLNTISSMQAAAPVWVDQGQASSLDALVASLTQSDSLVQLKESSLFPSTVIRRCREAARPESSQSNGIHGAPNTERFLIYDVPDQMGNLRLRLMRDAVHGVPVACLVLDPGTLLEERQLQSVDLSREKIHSLYLYSGEFLVSLEEALGKNIFADEYVRESVDRLLKPQSEGLCVSMSTMQAEIPRLDHEFPGGISMMRAFYGALEAANIRITEDLDKVLAERRDTQAREKPINTLQKPLVPDN